MTKFLAKTKRKEQTHPSNVPQLVIDCIEVLEDRGLTVEGILRVSGSNLKMRELRKEYEKGKQISLDEIEIHTIGGLLKNYFRDTKEPIFPFRYYDALLDISRITAENHVEYIKSIIQHIPESNQETLHWLIVFLNKVAQYSNENKMDLSNLATMFGPNLIRSSNPTATQLLSDLPSVRLIMLIIMRNYKSIFDNWPDDQIKKPIKQKDHVKENNIILPLRDEQKQPQSQSSSSSSSSLSSSSSSIPCPNLSPLPCQPHSPTFLSPRSPHSLSPHSPRSPRHHSSHHPHINSSHPSIPSADDKKKEKKKKVKKERKTKSTNINAQPSAPSFTSLSPPTNSFLSPRSDDRISRVELMRNTIDLKKFRSEKQVSEYVKLLRSSSHFDYFISTLIHQNNANNIDDFDDPLDDFDDIFGANGDKLTIQEIDEFIDDHLELFQQSIAISKSPDDPSDINNNNISKKDEEEVVVILRDKVRSSKNTLHTASVDNNLFFIPQLDDELGFHQSNISLSNKQSKSKPRLKNYSMDQFRNFNFNETFNNENLNSVQSNNICDIENVPSI